MTKRLISAALLCLSASAANADRAFEQCVDGSDQSDKAAIACGSAWVTREEAQLNATWSRALAIVGGSKTKQGTSLLQEQRAWIAFKDKSCLHYYTPGLSGLEYRNGRICRARVAADRTAQLENIIADFPGED
jgi:uncharacterized protein YecT (DUF1311 family)